MLPFTANEQVLYSAIPEMHSRHWGLAVCTTLDCQENRSVIKATIYQSGPEAAVIAGPVRDKTVWNNHFVFLFFLSVNTRRTLHIWASAIMQIMGTYLPECPWTTALNNYEDYVQCGKFAIQNNSYLSRCNCCRQIRLTLSVCFCTFGDILWGCLYNLIFTCKQ